MDADLLGPYLPPDFEEFWGETVGEALEAGLDWTVSEQDEFRPAGHEVRVLRFRGIDGEARYGWIATPLGVSAAAPGFLWLPPYSRWSMLPDEYGTRAGMASASLNFFGEGAFHRETYTPARGYFGEGAECARTWVFRRMFQDAVLLGRVLREFPEVDAGRLAACGMSQGGGMAVWMGAWAPFVRAVVADEPFLGGMRWTLRPRVFRYPIKELTDWAFASEENERAMRETLSYFDTVNQACFCQVPTRLTLGMRDPSVKPEQVRAVFEALPGEKELEELDWGHDWHPRMIEGGDAWLRGRLSSLDGSL